MKLFLSHIVVCAALVAAAAAYQARAQEDAAPSPHSGSLWDRDVLTGDWDGARTALERQGFRFGLNLTAETFANPTGGVAQGVIYDDLMELTADVDLERVWGWSGALIHANGYLTHGTGLSANFLGNNLLTVSNIEADRGSRLFDLYIQQTFHDGAISVRVGQIAANDEFFISRYAATFLNGSYGWPGLLSTDLPSGGPNYPLATPGLRIAVAFTDRFSVLAAVFNGDPAGPGPGSPLSRDTSGTNFFFKDGAFAITEASYRFAPAADAVGLPANYKLGIWYHSGTFADQHLDTDGISLADPASSGIAKEHHGNLGAYFVIDQMFWRTPGSEDRGLGVFARGAMSSADRNLISAFVDTGAAFKGVFRTDDVLGLAFTYARVGGAARAFDRDLRQLEDPTHPLRDFESNVELTYQVTITPWLVVQPDVQVVIHPGGHVPIANGTTPDRAIPNAVAFGFRTVLIF